MTILRLTEDHAGPMAALEERCFSLPWSEQTVRAELQNPIGAYWGAFEGGRLVGYAGLQMVLDEGHITNIATAPDRRRQGIADSLLQKMLAHAEERGLAFATLEVRGGNAAARALYEKYGFAVTGRRKGYYQRPAEDAILMTRDFS